MTIYILGANGYIGSHLLAVFLKEGRDVIAVDKNLDNLKNVPAKKLKMDLADQVPSFEDGDIIYHLATKKNYPSQFDQEGAFRDILLSTKRVVEEIDSKNIFLIFASSRCVYGKTSGLVSEDHPLNPITYYGVLKKECEDVVKKLDNYAIIRLSNVYGGYRPYDQYMGVADLFIYNAIKGLPIKIEGGKQAYDFTFIDDVIFGLKSLIYKPQRNYTVNFTSGKSVEIETLAKLVKDITKSQSTIELVEPRPWEKDTPNFKGDPRKCRELLGLEFKTPIWKGLQISYERYRSYINQLYFKYLSDYSLSQINP